MRKLKDYTPTKFMAEDSHYDKAAADYAVRFIECLAHTKGTWAGKPFELIDADPQGSLSVSLGIGDADALTDTLATVMIREMNHSVYLKNPRS